MIHTHTHSVCTFQLGSNSFFALSLCSVVCALSGVRSGSNASIKTGNNKVVLKTEHDCKHSCIRIWVCAPLTVSLPMCLMFITLFSALIIACCLIALVFLALCFVAFSCTNTFAFIGCHFCGRLINYGFSFRSHKISSKRNIQKWQWQWKWKRQRNATTDTNIVNRLVVRHSHRKTREKSGAKKKHAQRTHNRTKDAVKILLLAMGHRRQSAEKEHVAKDEWENDKRKRKEQARGRKGP